MAMTGEAGVAAEGAERVAEILQQDVEPGEAAGGALLLVRLLDTAEADEGATARFVGRHAVADVFFDGEIDVALEFGFEVGVALLLVEEGQDAVRRLRGGLPSDASFGGHGEDAAHDHREAMPVGGVFGPLLAAALGNGVVLRLAVVVGGAPFGGDPAALLEADERGVDGALVEEDFVAADLFDAARDAVAVQLAHGGEGLQDHEVEGALEEIEFL